MVSQLSQHSLISPGNCSHFNFTNFTFFTFLADYYFSGCCQTVGTFFSNGAFFKWVGPSLKILVSFREIFGFKQSKPFLLEFRFPHLGSSLELWRASLFKISPPWNFLSTGHSSLGGALFAQLTSPRRKTLLCGGPSPGRSLFF